MSDLGNGDAPRWGGHLLQNAVALMLSSGGTAVLGVVFWAVAARLATPNEVGRASAQIAAMVLLAQIAQLSFGSIFDRFLPIAGTKTRSFVTRAYIMVISVALVAGIVYVSAGFGEKFIPSSLVWRAFFVVAVVLWTIFILQDSVLTSLRATRWVPVENILFSTAKLALLPAALALFDHQGIFLAWTAPVAVATAVVSWYLFTNRIPRHQALHPSNERFPGAREIASLAVAQYATGLIIVFEAQLVVLIVINKLGATASAHAYLPGLIANSVEILLYNLVTSFLVEASTEPQALRQQARITLRAGLIVLVPSVTIGLIFAPEILRLFGPSYALHGTTLLRMLLLSQPFLGVTAFYTSFAWIDRRLWRLAVRELITGAVFFGILLALIGHFGILAVGIASLVSSGLQAFFFLPLLIMRYRASTRVTGPQDMP
jgi:O-antigen/teichoic acid export membrane protein